MAIQRFNAVGGYSTGLTATAVIDATGNITGVSGSFTGNFSGATGSFSKLLTASAGITTAFIYASTGSTFGGTLRVNGGATFDGRVDLVGILDVAGVSRFAAGVTFAGTLQGTTGSFSKLLTLSNGLSAAGGFTVGNDISVFGIRIGRGNRGASAGGDTNLAIGANALNSVIPNVPSFLGIQNLAFGTSALQNTTSGGYNSAFGTEALLTNTSGGGNIAFGVHALRQNTSGVENCAFGGGPMYQNTTGSYNVAIGSLAYYYKSTGNHNVAIGFQAGYKFGTPTGSNLTSATNCTLIGNYATPLVNGTSNEIVIGYEAIGKGSNTVSIGNSSITATHLTGVVNVSSGLSAAGGVTLAGTLQGTTAAFTGLVSSTVGFSGSGTNLKNIVTTFNGLSGAVTGASLGANTFTALNTFNAGISTSALTVSGGATFSSAIVLPINTAPALTIGNHSSKNLIMSSIDGSGLIEQSGNSTASLAIRQASGGPVLLGSGSGTYLALYENDNSMYLQSPALLIGDGDGAGNGTYLEINDTATTINAYVASFGVNGRLDMYGGYSEAGGTASQATNTITFNALLGNTQKFVPSAVVNTVNFTNIATTSTQCTSATLIFLHGATPYGLTTGTFSVQLAGVTKTVKWSGGSAPTLTNTANKTDILNFLTYDGGTTWLGFVGGLNF